MQNHPLYQEWSHILIPSSAGQLNGVKRNYRIFYGTVHWHTSDPNNIHKACTVFVQYGSNKNFEKACKLKEIKTNYPCHILDEDLDKITKALNDVKEQF